MDGFLEFLWPPFNTRVVLIGVSLLGASAGVVGCFAVLRGRALTGDTLAHAALPGLCVAFLIVGELSLPAMLLGALVSGVLGLGVISLLLRWTRIKEDAALGIVLGTFFGAGVVLSSLIQHTGGSRAGLESYIFGKTAGILVADVVLIALLALACMVVLLLFYKEFKLVAFDSGFGRVQGWPTGRLDLLLMVLIAAVVVVGLPMVGVVMMAALIILPGAAARFWTNRLTTMLLLAAAFGMCMGIVGATVSASVERLPAGPAIILSGTGIFLFSMLLAPRRGVLARFIMHRRFRRELADKSKRHLLLETESP